MDYAVITANIGDYDVLEQPHQLSSTVDYLYFTDGDEAPRGWERCDMPPLPNFHPRRAAKLPKIWPHFFPHLQEYDAVVWIDAGMTIQDAQMPSAVLSHMNNGLVVSPHFDSRDCAYGESEIRPGQYATEPLDEQVEFYRGLGFPEHHGLYETGVLAWSMDTYLGEIGQRWFLQNVLFSYQDQVSLPFVLWEAGFKPDVLPRSFPYMGNWVTVNAHTGPRAVEEATL